MRTPTRVQARVLKALQNQTKALNALVANATRRQQQSGQNPPQSWFEDYHGRAIVREELLNAAHAGGVPSAWIDHVRERGERGIGWRPELYLRAPDALDWDPILAALTADVHRLCEWSALEVAYQQISPAPDTDIGADFDRNLRNLCERTTGIANLLGLTAEQGQQLWGTTHDWAQTGSATLDGVPVEELVQRWHAVAHTDTRAYALQAIALAAAGITTVSAAALPQHQQLAAAIDARLLAPQQRVRFAVITGASIDTAINAANLTDSTEADTETATAATLFSDAASTDPLSFDTATDREISAPEFLSPVQGTEP
ncbi:hypothetical protein [Nocardia pseudovaccinii]|uniref:hypothetical protein n=1 Tax=Nocardia pseudovaccinii TaxID=189540 RepID=UPI000B15F643|nr:hypothetical protein [Nocardia pseudovaccinii]